MGILKHALKLFQLFSVLMIPAVTVQYYFKISNWFENINNTVLNFIGTFTQPVINGTDWTLLFLILPWIITIIIIDILINILDNLNKKAIDTIQNYKKEKITALMQEKKQMQKADLDKKTIIHAGIELDYAKFTISNLSDNELSAKKEEIKNKLYNDISNYKGNIFAEDVFENDDTIATVFFSQEDVLNYVFKLQEAIKILDDDIQNFGYSLNYKIILDVNTPEAVKDDVLIFLEKALKTVEQNEICATTSFSEKYKEKGKMKHINFVSKGTYSINKTKVELTKLNY